MPHWVDQGYDEYAKRIAPKLSINLIEVPLEKRTKNSDIKKIIQKETQKILSAVPHYTRIIALDLTGRMMSSQKIALEFSAWLQLGTDISFLIGGPDKLATECLVSADEI